MKKNFILIIIAFVLCFSVSAFSQTCQWAERIGGTNNDFIQSSTLDGDGNLYVTGYFNSAILEFNNGITLNNTGSNNAYIAKYDSEGDCSWAELISGTGSIYSQSIFVDLAGNVYITGYFNSTAINFNNNITLTNSASVDIFIAKYNSFAECQWAQKASGNLNDIARSITVDNNGNIFITGNFNSDIVSFNSGISLNRIGNSFYHDAFLSKYNSNGICQWATSIFGTNNEYSNSVTIDDTGNIYIVGTYSSDTVYFNNGINLTKEGQYTTHLFLAKYNTSGVCQWAEKTSSQTNTEVTSLKADNNGSVYFTGSTFSPIQFNNNVIIEASQRFGFVAKYDYSGVCQWAEGITGIMAQAQVTSVNFDISGNPYICGQYSGMSGTNLIFNNDITLIGNGTTIAGFLAKYNTSGVCQWAENYNGIGNIYNFNMNLSVNNSNEIYLTGNYGSTLEFNNNISLLNLGQSDGYIAKYTQTQETTGYELWGWEQWNTTLNQYGNDKDWSSISTYKEWFSSVIKTDGTLWRIWYPDDDFQVGTDNNWSKAAEGYMHTLALKENGTLWAWGDNYQGQLGLGVEFGYEENPVQIGTESDWAEINAGWYTSFAIKSNGTLWAWGQDQWDSTIIWTPTQIGSDSNWKTVAAGDYYAIGLKNDGTIWYIKLYLAPFQIGTATNWDKISVGANHNAAIKTDGTLWTWGNNESGQLGDGTTNNSNTPIQVGASNDWASVTCGNWNTVAIKTDGTMWTWGWDVLTPIQVGNDNTWKTVSAGMHSVIALKESSDPLDEIIISLNQGWNTISSSILPIAPNMENIFADLEELVIVKNADGQIFEPSQNINQIGDWNIAHGYMVYITAPATLQITGTAVDPTETEINLVTGWNLISYLRNSPLAINTALEGISSSIILVKNNQGQLYYPAYGLNTLGNMQQGQGYWLYMNSPAVLVYPGN